MASRIQKVPAERRADIARDGGTARAQALTPEERAEIARAGAAKTNSPLNYAQRIRRAWPTLKLAERRAVAEVLAGCKGLTSESVSTPPSKRGPRKVAPAPVDESTT